MGSQLDENYGAGTVNTFFFAILFGQMWGFIFQHDWVRIWDSTVSVGLLSDFSIVQRWS